MQALRCRFYENAHWLPGSRNIGYIDPSISHTHHPDISINLMITFLIGESNDCIPNLAGCLIEVAAWARLLSRLGGNGNGTAHTCTGTGTMTGEPECL